MKKLLFIFLFLLCGIASAQSKNTLSAEEKALIGKWSFNNPDHIMKDQIKGSENVLTIELKEDKSLNSVDFYSQKGAELLTVIEGGTWSIKGNEISLFFNGKVKTMAGGLEMSEKDKAVKQMTINGKKIKTPVQKQDKPRTVKYYYKFDKGNLLFSTRKDDFKFHSVFKKVSAK